MKTSIPTHTNVRLGITEVLTLILFIVMTPPQQAHAIAAKPVIESLEELGRLAGRVPSRGAAEALEIAFRAHGRVALETAEHGGLGLVEAAARHGDEVFRLASRFPEAAPALGARAGELLPLVARRGEDVLRIEAKLPGVAEHACQVFPQPTDLSRLARLKPEVLRKTVAFGTHAAAPATSRQLLRMAERLGGELFKNLKPQTILAGGLSLSMVIAAGGGVFAMWRAPEELFDMISDVFKGLAGPSAQAISWIVLLAGIVTVLALAEKLGVLRILGQTIRSLRSDRNPRVLP